MNLNLNAEFSVNACWSYPVRTSFFCDVASFMTSKRWKPTELGRTSAIPHPSMEPQWNTQGKLVSKSKDLWILRVQCGLGLNWAELSPSLIPPWSYKGLTTKNMQENLGYKTSRTAAKHAELMQHYHITKWYMYMCRGPTQKQMWIHCCVHRERKLRPQLKHQTLPNF